MIEAAEDAKPSGTVFEVTHWWCCDPRRALCGAEVDADWDDDYDDAVEPTDCGVCVHLYPTTLCHGPSE